MAKGGRPTKYTKKIAEAILSRIMQGQGVAEIGRDEVMPDASTVFRWLAKDEEFCERYTRAKEICAEYMQEEMLGIADDSTNDYMIRKNKDGEDAGCEVVNAEHIQRSRLRIETRKWLMSKLKPKKYGDKLALAGDADNPLTVIINKPNAD